MAQGDGAHVAASDPVTQVCQSRISGHIEELPLEEAALGVAVEVTGGHVQGGPFVGGEHFPGEWNVFGGSRSAGGLAEKGNLPRPGGILKIEPFTSLLVPEAGAEVFIPKVGVGTNRHPPAEFGIEPVEGLACQFGQAVVAAESCGRPGGHKTWKNLPLARKRVAGLEIPGKGRGAALQHQIQGRRGQSSER